MDYFGDAMKRYLKEQSEEIRKILGFKNEEPNTATEICSANAFEISKRLTKSAYYLDIAYSVSKRSTCLKRRYGCVIIKNDEIISTGYNGSPRGIKNCCDKGECKRMNAPSNSGEYSDCHSVHAEQNAMLSAARREMLGATMYLYGTERKWSEINQEFFDWSVITAEPCPICARMIANSGIKYVINNAGDIALGGCL